MHDLQMIGRRNMLCGMHVHVELPAVRHDRALTDPSCRRHNARKRPLLQSKFDTVHGREACWTLRPASSHRLIAVPKTKQHVAVRSSLARFRAALSDHSLELPILI
jgi:hypothetical protein